MDRNANIGEVDKPERFIESKAREEVPRCIISKCCIANAAAEDIEQSGGRDTN